VSLGYDRDDPRFEATLRAIRRGDFKVADGERPNTRRRAAMPDSLGSIGGRK